MNETSVQRRRVCLVGCGRIAAVHAGNLRNRADLYFHSRTRDSAEAMNATQEGKGVLDSFDDVLESPVDAAVICSPPEHHAEQIVRLLGAGKSVMVEKPMCVSPEQTDAIGAAAEGSSKVLMVAENYYYKPSLWQLKRLMSEDRLGPARRIDIRKMTTQIAAGWRQDHGALLEGGIHFVALLSGLTDTSPDRVRAAFPGYTPGGPERHCVLHLEYPGGLEATLSYAWDTPSITRGTFQHSRIVCERGSILFESNGLYVFARSGLKCRIHGPNLGDLLGYRAMTNDFLACLEDPERRPHSDLGRVRRDLGIVFEAYRQLPPAV